MIVALYLVGLAVDLLVAAVGWATVGPDAAAGAVGGYIISFLLLYFLAIAR